MAELKSRLTRQVPGSSIMEVIVAMVIIIVIFGTALMIYNNVRRLTLSQKKLEAEGILQELLYLEEQKESIYTRHWQLHDFNIEEAINPVKDNDDLIEINLTVFDRNMEKISEVNKLIIKRKNAQ